MTNPKKPTPTTDSGKRIYNDTGSKSFKPNTNTAVATQVPTSSPGKPAPPPKNSNGK